MIEGRLNILVVGRFSVVISVILIMYMSFSTYASDKAVYANSNGSIDISAADNISIRTRFGSIRVLRFNDIYVLPAVDISHDIFLYTDSDNFKAIFSRLARDYGYRVSDSFNGQDIKVFAWSDLIQNHKIVLPSNVNLMVFDSFIYDRRDRHVNRGCYPAFEINKEGSGYNWIVTLLNSNELLLSNNCAEITLLSMGGVVFSDWDSISFELIKREGSGLPKRLRSCLREADPIMCIKNL